mmetsp:Transcript_7756/g.10714  ORF Transcript_7756/g.10714 Transcript_7756/m.10714 type:complete len:86 (+) Transcript_7756:44-301(+)
MEVDEEILQQVGTEMTIKDQFKRQNKISEHCFNKCVSSFTTRTLSQSEASCVSDCFNKLFQYEQKLARAFTEIVTIENQANVPQK